MKRPERNVIVCEHAAQESASSHGFVAHPKGFLKDHHGRRISEIAGRTVLVTGATKGSVAPPLNFRQSRASIWRSVVRPTTWPPESQDRLPHHRC
jgi:hypothetical protein